MLISRLGYIYTAPSFGYSEEAPIWFTWLRIEFLPQLNCTIVLLELKLRLSWTGCFTPDSCVIAHLLEESHHGGKPTRVWFKCNKHCKWKHHFHEFENVLVSILALAVYTVSFTPGFDLLGIITIVIVIVVVVLWNLLSDIIWGNVVVSKEEATHTVLRVLMN